MYITGPRAHSDRERFEICAGALLTQNTAWHNAAKALAALNAANALVPERILALPQQRLRALIRSSGYYRQKALKLRAFCEHLLARHGGRLGEWFSGPLPAVREELLSLKGIGPETADSMLLYAGRRPLFVIDAYTVRLGLRMGWLRNGDYGAAQEFFIGSLPRSVQVYNEYHALIVELAKKHCKKSEPRCADCPLRGNCLKRGV